MHDALRHIATNLTPEQTQTLINDLFLSPMSGYANEHVIKTGYLELDRLSFRRTRARFGPRRGHPLTELIKYLCMLFRAYKEVRSWERDRISERWKLAPIPPYRGPRAREGSCDSFDSFDSLVSHEEIIFPPGCPPPVRMSATTKRKYEGPDEEARQNAKRMRTHGFVRDLFQQMREYEGWPLDDALKTEVPEEEQESGGKSEEGARETQPEVDGGLAHVDPQGRTRAAKRKRDMAYDEGGNEKDDQACKVKRRRKSTAKRNTGAGGNTGGKQGEEG